MSESSTGERRNLLFILADQLQAFAIGAMGHPEIRTPNLDALAAGGTLFRNAYVEYPVCTQYRGVLMTGRFAAQTGVTEFATGPADDIRCFADVLNDHGLWTSYVGKWHLYEFAEKPVEPHQRCGFTHFIGYQSYNDYRSGVRFWDEDGALRQFDGRHRTDATADVAVERLREIPSDQDFALFVSFLSPHYPLQPDAGFEALYRDVDISMRPNVTEPDQVFTPTWSPESPRPIEADPNYQRYGTSLGQFWRYYAAMVTQLDDAVGRLLAELRMSGRDDDTLIVFTSDHGEMGGSQGLMNKGVWYEESVRVPMIVRNPGGTPGTSVTTPVSAGIDILPTFLDWAGLPAERDLAGTSLVPMLDDATATRGEPIFSEATGRGDWVMMRSGRAKYVARRSTNEPVALFDLAEDPYEMTNRLDLADNTELNELRDRVNEWRTAVGLD